MKTSVIDLLVPTEIQVDDISPTLSKVTQVKTYYPYWRSD